MHCHWLVIPLLKHNIIVQGRSFSLYYLQYFNEDYLGTARSISPTHVLVNLGVWLDQAPEGCAAWDADDTTNRELAACPSMPMLCEAFEQNAAGKEGYELWWNGAVPRVVDKAVQELIKGVHLTHHRHD